jgi:sec-independent protein translocase protein TatA
MNIRGWELIIILAIILLIFGPSKIPGLARGIGKSIGMFRSGVKGVKDDLERGTEEKEVGKEPGKV